MGRYRLSEDAEADLIRIHQWGVSNYGETHADQYYWRLIQRFEELADNPLQYPAVDEIKPATGEAYAVLRAYIIASTRKSSKSWPS